MKKIRVMGVDMETATLFSVGFYNKIPTGALLLVSDRPMLEDGVKTTKSDILVTKKFVNNHLQIGINTLEKLMEDDILLKHLRFEM